jgi:hypothetical protein
MIYEFETSGEVAGTDADANHFAGLNLLPGISTS